MKYLFISLYLTIIMVFGLQAQIPHSIEKINFDYEINSAMNIAIDNNGFFYVYDRNESTILKLDEKGKLIKKIGSRGRGPGEFINVSLLLYNKDTDLLYAYDMPSFSIKEITTDGEFLNQYDYPDKQMVNPFYGFIDNGSAYLVFYNTYGLNQNIVHKTDIKKGKTIESYFEYESMTMNKEAIMAHNFKGSPYGLHSLILENNDIVLSNSTNEGAFYIQNREGKLKKISIPTFNINKSIKKINNPDSDKKYRKINDNYSEIYSFISGIAEIDSTILVFEQSNIDGGSFGYHRYSKIDYGYLGYYLINEIKIEKNNYNYINVYPQFNVIYKINNNIFISKQSNDKFMLIKLKF